jgi:hypothetical protein
MDETVDQRCVERTTTLKISGVDLMVQLVSTPPPSSQKTPPPLARWWSSVLRLICVEPRRSVNPESIVPFAR